MAGYIWQAANLKMAQHYSSVGVDELIRRIGSTETISPIDAYETVPWFGSSIDARRNAYTNLPYDIMRGETVLGDQDNTDDLDPRLDLSYILDDMFTDLDLHGAAYAIFEENIWGMNGRWRRWLPRSVVPRHDWSGQLSYFDRYWNGDSKTGIALDDPNFIWLWMPNYRRENYPGVGVGNRGLLAASNLLNQGKFQNAYFENGAIAPTLVRIKGYGSLDEDEKDRTENIFRQLWSGIRNAFRIHPIDGDEVDVVTLMQNLKDMILTELTNTEREEIAAGLGVPQNILMGNAANFATAQMDDYNLYDKWVVPQAKSVIADQLNLRHYKRYDAKIIYRPERLPVYQSAMLERSKALVPWSARGVVDDNEVRPLIGLPEREDLETEHEAEMEVPERLLNPADQEQDKNEQGATEGKMHHIGKEAYVKIDLANNPQLRAIQERLQMAMIQNGGTLVGDWQNPETFHITLVYCYDIENEALHRASETMEYNPLVKMPFFVTGISVFNNPEGQALHLTVSHSPKLDYLQKRIWVEFSGHDTSDYSNPAQWQPHITMGYLPIGVPAPQITFEPFELSVERVQYMRDGYAVFESFDAIEDIDELSPMADDDEIKQAIDDLERWERLALKRHKEGKPEKALEFESDSIAPVQHGSLLGLLSSVNDAEQVKALFAEAKQSAGEWLNYG